MDKCPCYNCNDRYVDKKTTCHCKCEKYLKWNNERLKIKKELNENKSINYYSKPQRRVRKNGLYKMGNNILNDPFSR